MPVNPFKQECVTQRSKQSLTRPIQEKDVTCREWEKVDDKSVSEYFKHNVNDEFWQI